jgi:predicted membrane-bound spermidine synthase
LTIYDTSVMEASAQSPLVAWETFFFLVGSSGAGLTGLQFVVIALISESRRRPTNREIEAFATPNILHFCAVLLISAIVSAPWHGMSRVALALGACGVAGVVYGIIVVKRARGQTGYRPVLPDWIWHSVLPLIAYTLLVVASVALTRYPRQALFVIGATSLLLLFVGIHNAWDTVTYIAVEQAQAPKESEDRDERQ